MEDMFTFLIILSSALFILLLMVTTARPMPSVISSYELERRAKRATKEAKAALRREKLLPDILVLQRVLTTLLLVAVGLLSVATFGWLLGVAISVLVTLEYAVIAKFQPLHIASQKLYEKIEPSLLRFVEKFGTAFIFLRSVPVHDVDTYHRFDSREELQQIVDASGDVLTGDERALIVNGLSFREQRVDTVMTPVSQIDSIKKGEFLGPLVLSELHDTGHRRLPVIGSDVNHVVGTLNLTDLLSLDIKRSTTAEKAMDPKVFYIREDQTLEHALAAFLDTHHHLFIVINELRETVGILTLGDVIEALLGRRIIDEDDNHESLHAIAAAKPVENNLPKQHTDV